MSLHLVLLWLRFSNHSYRCSKIFCVLFLFFFYDKFAPVFNQGTPSLVSRQRRQKDLYTSACICKTLCSGSWILVVHLLALNKQNWQARGSNLLIPFCFPTHQLGFQEKVLRFVSLQELLIFEIEGLVPRHGSPES